MKLVCRSVGYSNEAPYAADNSPGVSVDQSPISDHLTNVMKLLCVQCRSVGYSNEAPYAADDSPGVSVDQRPIYDLLTNVMKVCVQICGILQRSALRC